MNEYRGDSLATHSMTFYHRDINKKVKECVDVTQSVSRIQYRRPINWTVKVPEKSVFYAEFSIIIPTLGNESC